MIALRTCAIRSQQRAILKAFCDSGTAAMRHVCPTAVCQRKGDSEHRAIRILDHRDGDEQRDRATRSLGGELDSFRARGRRRTHAERYLTALWEVAAALHEAVRHFAHRPAQSSTLQEAQRSAAT